MNRPPLAEHQRTGIEWIERVGRGLLGDEPGLGKSRTAIEAFDGGDVLVVAPSMVITGGTWSDELERWANHPERFVVAPYSMLNERAKTGNGGSTPQKRVREAYRRNWDAIVVDEAHYIKGRSTSWTWAVQELAKRSGSVLQMTGTPMPNWAHDLFTLLQVIRPEDAKPGKPLGSYNRWVNEWFVREYNPFGGGRPGTERIGGLLRCRRECVGRPANDPCEHWAEFSGENLGDRFLRRLRKDALDLPPLTETVVHTPMDTTQTRMYRELKQDYLTSTADGGEVVAWSNGSRNVMLDRVTTSSWFLDPVGEPRGGKLERLRFDLENRSSSTLVLAHYRDTVEACAQVARSVGAGVSVVHGGISQKAKAQAVADFKSGKNQVLVGSLETLAEGLTLTVADMAIFVEKSYKPSRNEQAMRRVHRMGQTSPVTVLDYVTPNSVDENKRHLLGSKTDQQMRVLSAAEFARLL